MPAKKKNDEEHKDAEPVEEEVVETYYDDGDEHDSTGFKWKSGKDLGASACAAVDGARDGVLKNVPGDVTEHLVNSHNELLKAGVAFLESAINHAENVRTRSRDLHEPKED